MGPSQNRERVFGAATSLAARTCHYPRYVSMFFCSNSVKLLALVWSRGLPANSYVRSYSLALEKDSFFVIWRVSLAFETGRYQDTQVVHMPMS